MPESILVVDDDPDIARFVEVNLRSAGYEVSVAGDGEEALERASEIRPDLVLLDVMMPRLDGFSTIERLRADPATADIPVVVVTGRASAADLARGAELGVDAYVIKPFEPAELVSAVLRLAEHGREAATG
jgi:DNA-binding response OmpR family regulator